MINPKASGGTRFMNYPKKGRSRAAILVLLLSCSTGSDESELVQPVAWWRVHPRPGYAALEKVGTLQSWFDVYRLDERTYAIYEPRQFQEVISYLVLGEDRGILVDAGMGIGDIQQVVESLTTLPVSVALTHEHFDHIGGVRGFSEVAAANSRQGLATLAQNRSTESLREHVDPQNIWQRLPEDFSRDAWSIPPIDPTRVLSDGDQIDLGGREIEVLLTPGHSPGSLSLLDRKHRLLFTGDHFYPGPLYAHGPDVDIRAYLSSNIRLAELVGAYDHVLGGHNEPWVDSDVIPRVSQAFATILSGGGDYAEKSGLRRYTFDGFDVLIRSASVRRP